MASSDSTKMVIRIAGDTTSLQKAFEEGRVIIEKFDAVVKKLPASLNFNKPIEDVKRLMDVLKDAGGAATLTASQQTRVNATVQEAIAKYRALGQSAPADMLALEKATRQAGDATSKSALSFGTMAGAVAMGTAAVHLLEAGFHLLVSGGRMAVTFLESTIAAASEADAAMSRLTTAMKSQGNATPELIAGYREMSAEFQHTTTYSHDAIEGVMGTLIQLGNVAPANMKKALEATVNLAAGLGRDLEPTAQAVGKALGGNTTALSKLIPEIKKAGDEAKTAEGLLKILSESGFGGQAAAAATTYAGRIKQIGNEWTDLKETIGDAIVKNQTVRDAMSMVTDALIAQTGNLEGNRIGFELVSGAVIGLVKLFDLLVTGVDFVGKAWLSLQALAPGIASMVHGKVAELFSECADLASALSKLPGVIPGVNPTQLADDAKDWRIKAAVFKGLAADDETSLNKLTVASMKWGASMGTAHTALGAMVDALEATRGKEAETVTGVVAHRAALDDLGKTSKVAAEAAKVHALEVQRYWAMVDAGVDIGKAAIKDWDAENRKVFDSSTKGLISYLGAMNDAVHDFYVDSWKDLDASSKNAREIFAANTAKLVKQIEDSKSHLLSGIGEAGKVLGSVFANINSTFGQVAQVVGNGFKVIGDEGAKGANKAAAAFAMLGGVLAELAGGAPSKGMAMAMGAAGGAAAGAMVAGALIGMKAGASSAAATYGISIAVGALAGAIVGWATATMKAKQAAEEATKQTRIYEAELLATYGSLDNIAMLSNVVSVNLIGAFGRSGPYSLEQMNIAMKAFKAKMEELQGDLDKYGLTWLDLNDEMKKFTVGNSAAALLAAFTLMTRAGADESKVIKGMSGDFSQLIIDAINSGQKIPAALQPILTKLIEMGGLTDAAAQKMLGLADDTMPSLADIKAAAERYGLTLDQLGSKVTQLQITDTAKQVVADFDLLMLAGADVGTVMGGMQGSVQDLVSKALKLGLELPDSMKPLIQSMIDAGLLTDANGVKLEDLGKINFALDLTKAFDTLILKLDELIAKLTGPNGLTAGLNNLPSPTVDVHAHVIYDGGYFPGGDPNSGDEHANGPGFASGTHGRLLDFGAGTRVTLHGRERVSTAAEERTATGTDGGYMPVTLVMEGEPILKAMVKVAKRKGWA